MNAHSEINNQDKISSVSLLAPLSASIAKKIIKVGVLAHKSQVHDHLGRRISAAIQVKLLSDRKKYEICSVIKNNETFKSILGRMKKKVRCVLNYWVLCTYLVGANGLTIVEILYHIC